MFKNIVEVMLKLVLANSVPECLIEIPPANGQKHASVSPTGKRKAATHAPVLLFNVQLLMLKDTFTAYLAATSINTPASAQQIK
jgi:hypothetical protein